MQRVRQAEQLLAFAFDELGDRDAGPAGDDVRNFFFRYAVTKQAGFFLGLGSLFLGFQLTGQFGQLTVSQFSGLTPIIIAPCLFELDLRSVNFLAQMLYLAKGVLLVLPLCLLTVEAVAQLGHFSFKRSETLLGQFILLVLEGSFLNGELVKVMLHIVQLGRHGGLLCFNQRAGFINKVNSLIGQETVCNITVRQACRCNKCRVLDLNAVINFIAFFQATQDGNRIRNVRFIDHDRLETTLQRGVLLDILAVLVQRGRTDAVQLAAGQHGLEQVARIHRAVGLARADDGVQLIDEEDDLALGLLDLVEDALQAFLKLAAVFCTCDQRTHVQTEHGMILQVFGHISAFDPLRQPLGDGGLTDTGLTDQHGVVLAFAGQDTDDIANFRIASDYRVKLMRLCHFDKVLAILFQGVVGVLRVITRDPLIATHRTQLLHKFLGCDAESLEYFTGSLAGPLQNTEEYMLYADVFILHLLGLLLGGVEGAVQIVGDVNFLRVTARAGHAGQRLNLLQGRLGKGIGVNAEGLQQLRDKPVLLLGKGGQQMLLLHRVVGIFHRDALCSLQSLTGFLCHLFDVHSAYLL